MAKPKTDKALADKTLADKIIDGDMDGDMDGDENQDTASLISCQLNPRTGETVCQISQEQLEDMKSRGVMPRKVILEVEAETKQEPVIKHV